jgi:hypothetical protein
MGVRVWVREGCNSALRHSAHRLHILTLGNRDSRKKSKREGKIVGQEGAGSEREGKGGKDEWRERRKSAVAAESPGVGGASSGGSEDPRGDRMSGA